MVHFAEGSTFTTTKLYVARSEWLEYTETTTSQQSYIWNGCTFGDQRTVSYSHSSSYDQIGKATITSFSNVLISHSPLCWCTIHNPHDVPVKGPVENVHMFTWWKSRYQGTNFCQAFLGNVSRSWQKFAPWYLLFHMRVPSFSTTSGGDVNISCEHVDIFNRFFR